MLECYVSVSDLAICQRCPALFAYKIHMHEKSVWNVGIKSNGEIYGSAFHKEISEKFFNAASDPEDPLYDEIKFAASEGADSLERLVSEKFFLPFIENRSVADCQGKSFTTGQVLAMARAVRVWVRGMLIFFEGSRPVFLKPEGKLQGSFNANDAELIINGRYDAVIFNPDRGEVRLFEFKGFLKSDITVTLSQSLIYAWLIKKSSGIIPSVEIIYLDENRPEIFDSYTVRDMIISGLPGLFRSALDIILLRRMPEIMQDKNLCASCKFNSTCREDMEKIFVSKLKRRRNGASLLSLMVFFFAALVITAQVFFFSNNSAESVREDRDIQSIRMQMASLVEDTKKQLAAGKITPPDLSTSISYKNFYGDTKQKEFTDSDFKKRLEATSADTSVNIHKLDYTYDDTVDFDISEWNKKARSMDIRIFPPMKDHYLIRVNRKMPAENNFMLQVLVDKDGIVKTYEEIWW